MSVVFFCFLFWQTVVGPKPNLPEDFDACDHNAPQLRVRV